MSPHADVERRATAEADDRPLGTLDIGFAEERPAVTIALEELTREPAPHGTKPAMRLRFARGLFPPEGTDPFSPLRVPENLRARFVGVGPERVVRLHSELELHFAPGLHEFPLAKGAPVLLEYRPGATARARIEVGREEDGDGGETPVVRRLEVEFVEPLVIHNVLGALREVQSLFEDRTFGALLRSLPERAGWGRLQALLPGRFFEQADTLGVVLLERMVATPRWRRRSRTWELRVAFSGRTRWFDRVERPFRDLELPNVLIPTPFARLDQLVSKNPLASADVATGQGQALAFLRALTASVLGASGQVTAEVELPEVEITTRFVDGTDLTATLRPPERAVIEGSFRSDVTPDHATTELRGLRIGFPSDGLALDAHVELGFDLADGDIPAKERVRVAADVAVAQGSEVPRLGLHLGATHPLCRGGTALPLVVTRLAVEGAGSLSFQSGALALWPTTRTVSLAGELATDGAGETSDARSVGETRLRDGAFEATIELGASGTWLAHYAARTHFEHTHTVDAPGVPELSIDPGPLVARVVGEASLDGELRLHVPQRNAPHYDLRGNTLKVALAEAGVTLGTRRVRLPAGTSFSGKVRRGTLGPTGHGGAVVDVRWNLHGQPCLLEAGERSVSLLADGLRRGELTVVLEKEGRLRFEGTEEGLYGVPYFNALLNPAASPDYLLNLLRSEEALSHVVRALRLFDEEVADAVATVRMAALNVRSMFRREGFLEPRDSIPRPALARLLSLLLVGHGGLAERLVPIVKGVTDGVGLDVPAMKQILREQLEELQLDYEIDRIVRWLALVLAPGEPLPQGPAVPLAPLAEDPRYAKEREGLPSAADLYEIVREGRGGTYFARRMAGLAPYLTRPQLAWLLAHRRDDWEEASVARLCYAHDVKERVDRIAAAYGGMEYGPQAGAIAIFLGEAAGTLPALLEEGETPTHQAGALGPEEVAHLLQAGLATGRQGRQQQLNNRLLVELMEHRDDGFTLEVFVELGQGGPRALSAALLAFLDQDQDELRHPVDLVGWLSRKLDLPVPRQRDFMAGGRTPRRSYTEALDVLADAILARSAPYLARKAHLQTVRHRPSEAAFAVSGTTGVLAKRAQTAIAEADRVAARLRFTGRATPKKSEARAAYGAAFEACRALLAEDPLAFRAPWLKDFWRRNEEALRVRSVVRNYQEDDDRVRAWLHVRRGLTAVVEDEQALLDEVVEALWLRPEDRAALRRDPLVRLLVDPPAGRYDFTVVSAMGVITEGARGREFEATFRRLRERYGVQALRADTGTSRSLEYNAERVIDVVRRLDTPWGYVGYSQGCANGLMAESRLLAGTPDDERLLERFVTRNLLFSAANGSAHGSAGNHKLARALAEGEKLMKPYQATFSDPVLTGFYRAVRALLDSRPFIHGLGGWHSLSFERARDFHRDLQIVERAPTSTTRGVCDAATVPEALEYMYYLLGIIQPDHEHDTQVTIEDSVGHSTRVINDWTRALALSDTGSLPQAMHHWSPLDPDAEVAIVVTERDRTNAIYDGPKDRHILPWVEVNARFGRIAVR